MAYTQCCGKNKLEENMQLIDNIKQLRAVHEMIKQQKTGTPDMFASKLYVSRRTLYYILDVIKDLGGEIAYNRTDKTFFYTKKFDMDIKIMVRKTWKEVWQEIK